MSARRFVDTDAARAADLLGHRAFDTDSAAALRQGAALLRDGLTRGNYRRRVDGFVAAIDDVRARNADVFAAAANDRSVLAAPARAVLRELEHGPPGEGFWPRLAAALDYPTTFAPRSPDAFAAGKFLDDELVAGLSPDAHSRLVGGMIARDVVDVTPQEWRLFSRMTNHGQPGMGGHWPILVHSMHHSETLGTVTERMMVGDATAIPSMRRHVALREIRAMNRGTQIDVAEHLFRADPDDLSAHDWARLEAIVARFDNLPLGQGMTTHFFGERHFMTKLAEITHFGLPPDDMVRRYFIANLPSEEAAARTALDQERIATVLAELRTGSAGENARRIATREWSSFEPLVRDMPIDDQMRVIQALDGAGADEPRAAARRLLKSSDRLLAQVRPHSSLEATYAQTRELLDRNLDRLAGRTPADAVRGYARHPDYAEVGRIRSNLELLVATSPDVAPPAPVERATGEVLTW